ncbi:MAG: arginine--tRNA ligase, partial [Desulfobacterales bacterium]|nr:arginine--tRNA ligase [Desulfobacterales bacterium]
MIKQRVKQMVLDAACSAHAAGALASNDFPDIVLEEPKIGAHGDLATNFAMSGAATQKMAPRKIAQAVVDHIADPDGLIEKTEIAGPGFINFFIRPSAWLPVIDQVHQQDTAFGAADLGGEQKVQVEFVSANPTGPLHIGHGRGAVVGDTLAALLDFCGYRVEREYYINDAGRQILTLGRSVYLRCCQLAGQTVEFPEDAYQGDYIKDIARSVMAEKGQRLFDMPRDEAEQELSGLAAEQILTGIRQDLENLGVCFNRWYSEQTLYDTGRVEAAIAFLKQ